MKPYGYVLCVTVKLHISQTRPSMPLPIPPVVPYWICYAREACPPGESPSRFPSPAQLFRNTCACSVALISFKSTVRAGNAYTG